MLRNERKRDFYLWLTAGVIVTPPYVVTRFALLLGNASTWPEEAPLLRRALHSGSTALWVPIRYEEVQSSDDLLLTLLSLFFPSSFSLSLYLYLSLFQSLVVYLVLLYI